MVFLRFTEIQEYNITSIHMKYIKIHHKWFEEAFNSLYKQINRVNKLLPWDLAIFLNSLRCILDFKFWDAPSLTFPTHLGNTKSLVFIWAWSSIFISETVVMQISQLFMFQAPHTWFIVAQVMSFGEWLSIIARSELGSDLDCSVINARSELGSDLDCYELNERIS